MPGIGSQESVFSSARGRDAPEAPIRLPVRISCVDKFAVLDRRGVTIADCNIARVVHDTRIDASHKNAANAVTIKCALNATASHAALVTALEKLIEQIGWRGSGADDREIFYCEFCKGSHIDGDLIEHNPKCPIYLARAALATAKGETP